MECRTIPRVLHNISLKFGKQSYNIFLLSLVLLNNKLLNYKEHINMQELTLTTPSLLFSAVSLYPIGLYKPFYFSPMGGRASYAH